MGQDQSWCGGGGGVLSREEDIDRIFDNSYRVKVETATVESPICGGDSSGEGLKANDSRSRRIDD